MKQDQTSTATDSVNDRQVGGAHYKDSIGRCPGCGAEIQHWDLFGMLPYLIGCATKYILRHRSKGGRLDLEKAKHYIEKIIEQEYPEEKGEPAHSLPAVKDTAEQLIDDEKKNRAARERAESFAANSQDTPTIYQKQYPEYQGEEHLKR